MENLEVIPAIDLIDGKVVRLKGGDFNQKTTYGLDPVLFAKTLENAGFERLHIVDLEGAKEGRPLNLKVIENVRKSCNIKVDASGGIRTKEDCRKLLSTGVDWVVLGSLAVEKPELTEELINEFTPKRFIIGADIKNGELMTKGWQSSNPLKFEDFVSYYLSLGVSQFLSTDISYDGMMNGPSYDWYKYLINAFPNTNWIASGGVRDLEDLKKLKEIGIKSSVVGKALLDDFTKFKPWL